MKLDENSWSLQRTPEEAENVMIRLFAQVYSATIEAFVGLYGEPAVDAARDAFIRTMVDPIRNGEIPFPDRELNTFIAYLVSGICMGHRGKFINKEAQDVQFCFTECPYATIFRQIGREKIGRFFCEADEPLLNAFNKKIKFERHHTLMDGDGYCDHHYFTPPE